MNQIVLAPDETARLVRDGYVAISANGQCWQLVSETYDRPILGAMQRHIGLTPEEIDIIARMPEGLITGETTIRSAAAR